ncbi:ankyrin repeat domain-containing protein [Breznakiella homolactica]|uniref:Ankyrin repeat domain-containing protein n=1 Tax=Breznakiella homolactica TaxID=2798577 RepID=A0A7T8BAA8_9SPIR|nr:ankyrin repeat domain-containing protein [Breznakiella homolactica]QQO09186.1 ankyrin repeat domain-containing protein [Breznakiella homolactica]
MQINEIQNAYFQGTGRDAILQMYKDFCAENAGDEAAKTAMSPGYGGGNLLHQAVKNVHPEAVEFLLEEGFNPNDPDSAGALPVFTLAKYSYPGSRKPEPGEVRQTALLLLDARAGILRKDEADKLCYHYAARDGNWEFVDALKEKEANLTKADDKGNTGLHLAAEYSYNHVKDLEKAKEQVAKKKDEENLPEKQRSPVSLAELEGRVTEKESRLEDYFKTARVFFEAGVDPDEKNNMLETAHTLAVRNGAKKIAALLDGSYSPEDDGNPDADQRLAAGGMTLHQAVRQKDTEAIRAIIEMGADPNEISDDQSFSGMMPLGVACSALNDGAVRLLLDLGADPRVKNGSGSPAAAFLFGFGIDNPANWKAAGEKKQKAILRMLVEKGYDINDTVNDDGDTLLGLACRSPYGKGSGYDSYKAVVVDECLRLKADPDKASLGGQTPLMLACGGDFNTMESIQLLLLEAGAAVDRKDQWGNTALHYAAANSSLRGAKTLAEVLFDFGDPLPDAANNEGKTALDYATAKNNETLVKLLLTKI